MIQVPYFVANNLSVIFATATGPPVLWFIWFIVLVWIFILCLKLVYPDGRICLDILQKEWGPAYELASVLTSIQVRLTVNDRDQNI